MGVPDEVALGKSFECSNEQGVWSLCFVEYLLRVAKMRLMDLVVNCNNTTLSAQVMQFIPSINKICSPEFSHLFEIGSPAVFFHLHQGCKGLGKIIFSQGKHPMAVYNHMG